MGEWGEKMGEILEIWFQQVSQQNLKRKYLVC